MQNRDILFRTVRCCKVSLVGGDLAKYFVVAASVEEAKLPTVRREGDGIDVHRRTQGVDQSPHGQPRKSPSHKGKRRVQVFASEVQEIQQVRRI